jgi:hypothetical protein
MSECLAVLKKMKAAEVATTLGCCKRQVYRLFHRGELDGHRVDDAIVFYAEGVEKYISRNRNTKVAVPQLEPPKAGRREPRQGPGPKTDPAFLRYFGDLLD